MSEITTPEKTLFKGETDRDGSLSSVEAGYAEKDTTRALRKYVDGIL
jgi:hypothetical protein